MNQKVNLFIKKTSYALSSNVVSLFVSILTVLIFPKVLGIEGYSLFQLYIFYCSYVGIFHFGFNDGIYLRLGGQEYREIDKKEFHNQLIVLVLSQLFFGFILLIALNSFYDEPNKKIIFLAVCISLVIVNIRVMLVYILQATNKIKEASVSILIDRTSFLLISSFFILFDLRSFKLFILFDLIGKILSLLYAALKTKNIVINKFNPTINTINEIKNNINSGIKMMIANFSNILIVGNIRFFIERLWSVAIFGQISLALSISNLIMVFINSLGIVIFPLLRKIDFKKLAVLYTNLRISLSLFLFVLLLFYYPSSYIFKLWLPNYKESFIYLSILFPIIVYEGRTGLLLNTFLKTIRKESQILKVNLLSVLISIAFALIFSFVFKNLTLLVLSITILLAIRSIILELTLSRILNLNFKKEILLELIIVVIFILSNALFIGYISFSLYLLSLVIYLLLIKHKVSNSLKFLRIMLIK
ncbi:hypothetical protein [Exiguobacterium acetylicum]|uniref:hypothetical protein n=1 Tax=Exiguobacterium acetylicum TaxID=41170 RepID=UPI0011EF2573|nr:hypothetical protein [Exiguobacterium acetylicum]